MIKLTDSKSLRNMNASDFNDGDIIVTNKYIIHIVCGEYDTSFESWVENRKTHKALGCTPGTSNGWPYYIADFINR